MNCNKGTALVFIAICGMSICTRAQSVTRPDTVKSSTEAAKHVYTPPKPKGPKPIAHEASAGFRLNSDGWSAFVDLGRVKPRDLKHANMFYNIRFWQIEFTEKYSPRETKITGDGTSSNNKYKYGKINDFYALKLGRGYTKMLAGKPDPGSVSIHWIYEGGLSLGLLKPYYLKVYSDPNAIKYSDNTKEDFLNQQLIEGSAGGLKGIGETKLIPGAHFKSAIHFDFSANLKTVFAAEAGFNIEYYSQQVQLMANQSGSSLFADLYLSLQVGKRW